MLSRRRRARTQRNLLLIALLLAAYYLSFYRTLSTRVDDLATPLSQAFQELARIEPRAARPGAVDLSQAQLELETSQEENRRIQELVLTVGARIEPDAVTRARMTEPFQLLAFQNERKSDLEELTRKAQAAKTTLEPQVSQGFPEYLAEQAYPELLWPQLQMCKFLVTDAIQSGASSVKSIKLLPVQFHRPASDQTEWLAELSADITLTGSAPNLGSFLEQLPLRAGEIKDRGLPETAPSKPILFIRGLVMRKEGRENPNHAQLELTASCFVRFARSSD